MREKLIDVFCTVLGVTADCQTEEANQFVDKLIANGVTIQPLADCKQQTNADCIRAMTDEELAVFLSAYGCPCPARNCHESCADCVMEWLQQPAEGE